MKIFLPLVILGYLWEAWKFSSSLTQADPSISEWPLLVLSVVMLLLSILPVREGIIHLRKIKNGESFEKGWYY
jgi:hypothetical protein